VASVLDDEQGDAGVGHLPYRNSSLVTRRQCRAPAEAPRPMRRLPRMPGEFLAYPAVPEFPISPPSPLLPQVATEPPPYPGIHLFQRQLYFRKATISVPAFERAPPVPYDSRECHPSRPACLLASLVFERLEGLLAHPTPGGYCLVKLNPRNVRRQGRSTALLALCTTSFSWRLRNRVTLANTRSPARALFT
jgi:hypothetical protein